MKVRQLLEYLQDKNPDAEVVIRGQDHDYYKANVSVEKAVYEGLHLSEYYDKGNPVGVIVIDV